MRTDTVVPAQIRETRGKNEARRTRRSGLIPAVIYGAFKDPVSIAIDPKAVNKILRSKTEVQALIRDANKAAVMRSRATLLGKLLERVAPCFRRFAYDPRDMRCICDPMDYVLFHGLTVERKVNQITFIEVKSGRSGLSGVQRSVRDTVERGRVDTEVWEIGDPDIPITKQLSRGSRRALPAAHGK